MPVAIASEVAGQAWRECAGLPVSHSCCGPGRGRSRSLGQIAHATWSRRPNPGETISPEVIGVDLWIDADQMNAYYQLGIGFEHFGPVFAGEPQTSAWQAAEGQWTEW